MLSAWPFHGGNLLVLMCAVLANGGVRGEEPSLLQRTFTQGGATMPYLLRIPAGYDPNQKYPLVLCFHGAGGRGVDNTGRGSEAGKILRSEAVQEEFPCFVLQPQCPEGKKWVDVNWAKGNYQMKDVPMSEPMTLAMAILNSVLAEYSVDRSRIYVTGQSMGGFATWDAILRAPDLFAAAIPVCGGGDPSKAEVIKTLPIWTFHGDADETIPVTSTREMVEALRKVQSPVIYTELAGEGHGSWEPAWKDADLLPWLFQQRRSTTH